MATQPRPTSESGGTDGIRGDGEGELDGEFKELLTQYQTNKPS